MTCSSSSQPIVGYTSVPKRTKLDAPAISRFACLMEQRNWTYWSEEELEKVLPSRRTKPDFFARTMNGVSILIEIESFQKHRFALKALRENPVMSGLGYTDNKRFSTALQHACRQLKPYRDLKFPCLVVLDDFREVSMPLNECILGLHLLRWFQENSERNHMSAVAWLLGEPSSLRLRVFHNPNSSCALASDSFGSPHDEHWQVSPGEFWKRA